MDEANPESTPSLLLPAEKRYWTMPNRKPVAGAIAGGIVVLVVWASKAYFIVEVPAEMASTLTMVLSFVTSYMVPEAA